MNAKRKLRLQLRAGIASLLRQLLVQKSDEKGPGTRDGGAKGGDSGARGQDGRLKPGTRRTFARAPRVAA